jgi:L-ribulose-5-phosphate 3-epimerase
MIIKVMTTTRREFVEKSLLAISGVAMGIPTGPSGETELQEKKPLKPPMQRSDPDALKISVFSKQLQWLSYDGMAKALTETGFDGADLTVRPGGHVLPERVESDLPKAVEALAKEGKKVYMMTTAIDNADDPLTVKILKTASSLGIKHYRMNWRHYDDSKTVEENIGSIRTDLTKLAKLNEKYSISGEYQNHSGVSSEGIYFGGAIWDIAGVLKDINSPWLGSQYDVYHATVEGANTWPVGLKLIAPYIRTIDIKDFKWVERDGKVRSESVPLGTGMVNFDKFFSFLKNKNIEVPVSMHFEYPLGGAENGATTINVAPENVFEAMRNDLQLLKKYLRDAALI